MTKKKKSPFEDAQEQIDLRLGGLLGELGSALSEALNRLDDQGEVRRETVFESDKGPIRASAGVRIRTLGGTHSARNTTRGRSPDQPVNTARTRTPDQSAGAPETREISATILSDDASWTLIADLPGVSEENLDCAQDGSLLRISATGRGRAYTAEYELPEGFETATISQTLQNGILELRLNKADTE